MTIDTSNRALMIKRVNLPHKPNYKYSPEKRIEVVTKYLALGNMRLVSELTGVSYQLIRLWKTQDWWIDLEAEIRASRDIQVDNKLSKIVDRALEMVADRLENGDVVWDKETGDVLRKPVPLMQVHKIAQESLTQQVVQSKKAVHESTASVAQSVADQIKMLAQEFAKFNTNRTVNVQSRVIQGETTDALYDERETGLQEAVREVRWTPGSDQEEDGEEPSSLDDDEGGAGSQGGWEGRGSPDASEQGWIDEPEQPESGESDNQSVFFQKP